MKVKTIHCPECSRLGKPPSILGRVDVQDGELELWCRKCRKPITVKIRNGEIKVLAEELHD